ncbi:hypothetical protein M3_0152 [Lysinibacillus phage vB_LfM_LysYB1]|nr:hypothetical protein M3_0152 [Lysinibacillus phage vB_LfM_LysYB1]WAB25337.1 hypothetical protein M5_0159 [Lysinibacillus phage vB_LfM_LysYB2]
MSEYIHVVISSQEEQSTKMVYSSKKKGIIKVQYLDAGGHKYEYSSFTQETLETLIREQQEEGYFITSYVPLGRSAEPGITLNSTIIMAKKVTE